MRIYSTTKRVFKINFTVNKFSRINLELFKKRISNIDMPDYHKLLLNLEESIFHLVQKRDYQLSIENHIENNNNDIKRQSYDKKYILTNINI